MPAGIAFPHSSSAELAQVRPLLQRLQDMLVAPPRKPAVAVHAAPTRGVRGAWNVQVFQGLGHRGLGARDVLRWRAGRATRGAIPAPGRSRHQQLNAYGPRFADLYAHLARDAEVSTFGHVALNELGSLAHDPEGPVVWLPTWGKAAPFGAARSSFLALADTVGHMASPERPFLVKPHPAMPLGGRTGKALQRLARTPGVTLADADLPPYRLLDGARCVLTDGGSLGLEAYCCGLPVAVATPAAGRGPPDGIVAELLERVPTLGLERAPLVGWADQPEPPSDATWARDLLYEPDARRNDAFAAQLRAQASTGALRAA